MGRRLRTTATTKYSLFAGAEQHTLAALTFGKADYLISWRAAGTAPCPRRRQAVGKKTGKTQNLPAAVQSGRRNFQIQRASKTEQ